MTARVFVDTNVLVYARDAAMPEKQQRAAAWIERLWSARSGRLSYQVLQEFYATVTLKLRPGLDATAAREEIRMLLAWDPLPVDARVVEGAWRLQDRHALSWWDALIVAAAEVLECSHILTEDLQAGHRIGAVAVVSPFDSQPSEVLA